MPVVDDAKAPSEPFLSPAPATTASEPAPFSPFSRRNPSKRVSTAPVAVPSTVSSAPLSAQDNTGSGQGEVLLKVVPNDSVLEAVQVEKSLTVEVGA